MLKFKIDILGKLRDMGVTSFTVKETGILSQSTFTKMKSGIVPCGNIDRLCELLKMQPGDLIEWVPDDNSEK